MSATDLLALLIVAGEWTGLARGIIGAPLYAGALDLLLMALTAVVGYRWIRDGGRRLPVIGVLILFYIGLAALEIFNPNVPGLVVGLEGFRKSAFTMVAFFAVFLSRSGGFDRFYKIIVIGSLPAFLWAIRQFFAPLPSELNIIGTSGTSIISFHSGPVLRAFSPTAGPFHLGLLAALVIVIATVLSQRGSRWWLGAAVVAAVALGLTITRANIAAGLVSVIVLVLISAPGLRLRTARTALISIFGVVLSVLFAVGTFSLPLIHVPPSAARLQTAAPSPTEGATPSLTGDTFGDVIEGITSPLKDTSLRFRFGYWREYLRAIAERPLLGYGTSAAADGFDDVYAAAGRRNFEPHSMYLKPALEMGLPGVALFAAIGLAALLLALRGVNAGGSVGLIGVGMIAVLMITGLTGPMLDAYPVNLLIWATSGWLAGTADSFRWKTARRLGEAR